MNIFLFTHKKKMSKRRLQYEKELEELNKEGEELERQIASRPPFEPIKIKEHFPKIHEPAFKIYDPPFKIYEPPAFKIYEPPQFKIYQPPAFKMPPTSSSVETKSQVNTSAQISNALLTMYPSDTTNTNKKTKTTNTKKNINSVDENAPF